MTERGFTDGDAAEVADNPEWTAGDVAKATPFADAFPDLAAKTRKMRGRQKAPTKKLVSLRLSPDVLERFKEGGRGWQARIDLALRKAVGL